MVYILKVKSKGLGRLALGKESKSLTGGCVCGKGREDSSSSEPGFWTICMRVGIIYTSSSL